MDIHNLLLEIREVVLDSVMLQNILDKILSSFTIVIGRCKFKLCFDFIETSYF